MFSLIHGYYLIKIHFADNVDTVFVTKMFIILRLRLKKHLNIGNFLVLFEI